MRQSTLPAFILGCVIASTIFVTEVMLEHGLFIGVAQARVGRPVTPVSYAGVARRTTRRVVAATPTVVVPTTTYVTVLPTSCTKVIIEDDTLYKCGDTHYQVSGDQYVIVKVK